MKFLSFDGPNGWEWGIADNDVIRRPSDRVRKRFPTLRRLLESGEISSLSSADFSAPVDPDAVILLPPIPDPDKILCVGVNYRPHIEEMGRDIPEYPVVFVRFPGSLVGAQQALVRPSVSTMYDFEGELAIVIGKRARHVEREDALSVIAGYTCFMDGSVRDWQKHTMQFTAGKNFDKSGSMGPYLVTSDEVPVVEELALSTRVNDQLMQTGHLADLVFDVPRLVQYCSTFAELLPGDIIATGTPGGVGAARTPPSWLNAGDIVEIDIPGIGKLRNPVVDETC